jgi:hypothetical protein
MTPSSLPIADRQLPICLFDPARGALLETGKENHLLVGRINRASAIGNRKC